MIRQLRRAGWASLALLLILPAAAGAQSANTAGRRLEQTSSWQTTTHFELPPATRASATGTLPPAGAPKPGSRLTGQGHTLSGIASYYWQAQKTATGETFDKMAMTAAHKTLPFGTRVRVTHQGNGRSVVVRINDRGPFKAGRVIDLSYAAAGAIDMRDKGLAPVRLDIVK